MQCIIFFMVILSAQYIYGVSIKFPRGGGEGAKPDKKELRLNVFIQADYLDRAKDGSQKVIQDGILKLNGKEIALVTSVNDKSKWPAEREIGFRYLQSQMKKLIKEEGYKSDQLMIQGDMKTYHWKVMRVIDAGKADSVDGFSLMPPPQ
jgi:biopolymer transport protein ExbD